MHAVRIRRGDACESEEHARRRTDARAERDGRGEDAGERPRGAERLRDGERVSRGEDVAVRRNERGTRRDFGTVAIIGDALHSVIDVAAALLTFGAVRLAAKPPDENHPFGHGRAENLAALGEALIMLLVGAGVLVEAVRRLASHKIVTPPLYALFVIAAATVIGAWRARTLRRAADLYS